jgi:hypothetical protein
MKVTIDTTGLDRLREATNRGLLRVNEVDLLYAGQRQVERILDRTAQGKDSDNSPFTPYKRSKRPYYYYPTSASGMPRDRIAITKRYFNRMGGGTMTRSGLGVRFDSYGDMKRALGRAGVDLMGVRAPHMLQALVASVEGNTIWIGIYGAEAARAEGHNEGTMTLPRRHFLDVNSEDVRLIGEDIAALMGQRLIAIMDGQRPVDPIPPGRERLGSAYSKIGPIGAALKIGSVL